MSVEIRELSFSYGKREVLHNINLTAQRGQMISVLGANGSGKSTLFRCILGLRTNYGGEVDICHKDIRTVDRRTLSKMVAYVPQNSRPVFNYTVREMIMMGTCGAVRPLINPGPEQIETVENAIEKLHIADIADRGIAEISGGELQLALISRAIVQRAKVLVMDEPTASLDYGNQHRVLKMVRELADQSYTILVAIHNPEQAREYSTHVASLEDGVISHFGPAQEIVTEQFIRQLYHMDRI